MGATAVFDTAPAVPPARKSFSHLYGSTAAAPVLSSFAAGTKTGDRAASLQLQQHPAQCTVVGVLTYVSSPRGLMRCTLVHDTSTTICPTLYMLSILHQAVLTKHQANLQV